MSEILRDRIQERMNALAINVFEAERRAGLKRGFLNDLMIGKKGSLRDKVISPLAEALDCDPEYLRLSQPMPRRGSAGGVPLSGIAEAGAWRETQGELGLLPVAIDPRFPSERIRIFLVRGDHAGGLGVTDGSVVTVLTGENSYRDGDIVLVKRERQGAVELSIRVLAEGALSARPLKGTIDPINPSEAEVVGVVVNSVRIFGLRN